MRKIIISILLLLLCISFACADDFSPPSNSVAGFKIEVPASDIFLEVYFFSYPYVDHRKISGSGASRLANNSETSFTTEDDGSVPKFAFRVKTRRLYNLNIRLTFSPMINDNNEADPADKYGFYTVTIYNPSYWDDDYMDDYLERGALESLDVDTVAGVSTTVTTPDMHVPVPKNGIDTWLYPLAFDFSNYLDGYNGSYTGTIKVEVLSQ